MNYTIFFILCKEEIYDSALIFASNPRSMRKKSPAKKPDLFPVFRGGVFLPYREGMTRIL